MRCTSHLHYVNSYTGETGHVVNRSVSVALFRAARFCSFIHPNVIMKKNKKIREPFDPADTPKPPQIIEPNAEQQRENPLAVEENRKEKTSANEKNKKPRLLADEAQINDDTTI